jgi:hypothetical protein
MSAFDVIYDDLLQAFDLYAIKYAERDADRPRIMADHFSKLDRINDRARKMGVDMSKALSKALDNWGATVMEAY